MLLPLACFGTGLPLPDQDTAATGRGEAFVATADNPSAIYYNPAGITQLSGQRALWHWPGAATGHVTIPRQSGFTGVRVGPSFLPRNREVVKELILRGFIPGKDGREFHLAHRADEQTVGAQTVEQLRGGNAEARIGLSHVDQQAGVDPPRPSVTLSGAEFGHPLVRRAGLRVDAAREAEHGHRAKRSGLADFLAFLGFQPNEQLPRVRIIQTPDSFNRFFHCAHGGNLNKSPFIGKL